METVSAATMVGGAQIMRLVAQCGNSFGSNYGGWGSDIKLVANQYLRVIA